MPRWRCIARSWSSESRSAGRESGFEAVDQFLASHWLDGNLMVAPHQQVFLAALLPTDKVEAKTWLEDKTDFCFFTRAVVQCSDREDGLKVPMTVFLRQLNESIPRDPAELVRAQENAPSLVNDAAHQELPLARRALVSKYEGWMDVAGLSPETLAQMMMELTEDHRLKHDELLNTIARSSLDVATPNGHNVKSPWTMTCFISRFPDWKLCDDLLNVERSGIADQEQQTLHDNACAATRMACRAAGP